MTGRCILVWYRNDLRVHDHKPLAKAIESGATVVPAYCFDDRHFGQTQFGFAKTGPFRAKFLLESVADLRRSLQSRGSDLVVRSGLPEVEIVKLAQEVNASSLYFHQEVTFEELQVEKKLEHALNSTQTTIEKFWGHTLYHPDALPFSLAELPELFTHFRKQVEKSAIVDPVFPTPIKLPSLPETLQVGEIPDLNALGLVEAQGDSRQQIIFQGGETAGIDRVQTYVWQRDRLKTYKETRNGMLTPDDSTKFSPWLAIGCLSPRYLYWQVKDYEAQRVQNDSTYWLIFELLWRDYFRYICAKHGSKIFQVGGLQQVIMPWKNDRQPFDRWCEGKTGFPLVDANMQELAVTGFMSNRGRQNVASFLTKNLGIDWRMGAEYFESMLIDYDVCSNWGNWNYAAGVGNDARGFRFFNISKQSKDYDPQGDYAKHWLPVLAKVPGSKIHEPWKLSRSEQVNFGFQLGIDYPEPIVDLFQSAEVQEKIYNCSFGITTNPQRNSKTSSPRKPQFERPRRPSV